MSSKIVFVVVMNIKKEMRSNEDIFRIKCDKCDNTYFDKCNLVRHYKLDHLKWTKCQLCGAISKDSKKHLAKFCAVKFPENREKEEKSIKYKILLNKKRGRTSDIVLDSSLENKKAENDNSIKNEVIMNENNDAKSDKVIITKMDSFCYRNMKKNSHKDFSNQFDCPVEKYFMNNSIYNTSSFSYLGIAKKSSKEKKVNYNTENENVDIDEKNANNIVNIKEKNKEEPCENEQKIKVNNQNNNSKYNVNESKNYKIKNLINNEFHISRIQNIDKNLNNSMNGKIYLNKKIETNEERNKKILDIFSENKKSKMRDKKKTLVKSENMGYGSIGKNKQSLIENKNYKLFDYQNKNKYSEAIQNKTSNNKKYLYLFQDYIKKSKKISSYYYMEEFIIGKGILGQVNFGFCINDGSPVAIKKQIFKNDKDELNYEVGVMKSLEKAQLFPKFIEQIYENNQIYVVETIEGPSLNKLWNFYNKCRKLDIKTVYKIGIELLINLKLIHEYGWLHVDIKDANILSLREPKIIFGELVHFCLADFGWSIKYLNDKGEHLKEADSLIACGNYYYASINALEGLPISRRDDLESLCYLLYDMCNGGKFPWKNINEKDENILKNRVLKMKKEFNFDNMNNGDFEEIEQIFQCIKKLKYGEKPCYEHYIKILKEGIKKNNADDDMNHFIWEKKLMEKMKNIKKKNIKINKDYELKILFKGFPIEYINEYLKNLNNISGYI